MKKIVSIVLVCVLAASMLCACGAKKPKGTYVAEMFGQKIMTMEFSGNKVVLTDEMSDEEEECTFEIDEDEITIENEDGDTVEGEYDADKDEIEIEGLEFEKED